MMGISKSPLDPVDHICVDQADELNQELNQLNTLSTENRYAAMFDIVKI